MADSDIVEPHFYIFDNFYLSIEPSFLNLGSILKGLDEQNVRHPLDDTKTIEVPDSQLRPIDKPLEMKGFSRSLSELIGWNGKINWGAVVGSAVGIESPLLQYPEDEKIIVTVKKLHARYFLVTPDYINKALKIDGVASYIEKTERKKPVYMITGLLWTEGAGVQHIYYTYEDSTPFILGIRVRKIWWDGHGVRCEAEDEFGATFDNCSVKDEENLKGVEDESQQCDHAT